MNGAQEQLFEIEIDFSFCSAMCVVAYYETNCNGSSAIISDYTCMDVEEKCSNDVSHGRLSPNIYSTNFCR